MIYRVAGRAVGWWLGSGHGRPAGGAARRPPRLSPDVVFDFFKDVPRRLLCLRAASGGGGAARGGPREQIRVQKEPKVLPKVMEGSAKASFCSFGGPPSKFPVARK